LNTKDSVIVVDRYFILTKNLISVLSFNRIERDVVKILAVAYFFDPSCIRLHVLLILLLPVRCK